MKRKFPISMAAILCVISFLSDGRALTNFLKLVDHRPRKYDNYHKNNNNPVQTI